MEGLNNRKENGLEKRGVEEVVSEEGREMKSVEKGDHVVRIKGRGGVKGMLWAGD